MTVYSLSTVHRVLFTVDIFQEGTTTFYLGLCNLMEEGVYTVTLLFFWV